MSVLLSLSLGEKDYGENLENKIWRISYEKKFHDVTDNPAAYLSI